MNFVTLRLIGWIITLGWLIGLPMQSKALGEQSLHNSPYTNSRLSCYSSGASKSLVSAHDSLATCDLRLATWYYLARKPAPSSNARIPATCPTDLVILTTELLRDLPSYANRVIQSTRLVHAQGEAYSYVIVAGRPEFAPLTLGPGEYLPSTSVAKTDQPRQVFITTLERQYLTGREIDLQQYHWLFLAQTPSGWQLAMMFSSIGTYPATRPPTPPRDSTHGVIAQAIRTWLEDCRAGNLREQGGQGRKE